MTPDDDVARWATRLGLGGLIPFFATTLIVAMKPGPWTGMVVQAQMLYAVTILTFVGALHWGFAFRSETRKTASLIWSVVPSLYAWVVAMLPVQWSLLLLSLGLLTAWAVDRKLYPALQLPAWFMTLRTRLTIGACASLLITWELLDFV